MPDSKVNVWLQRLSVAAMVAVAVFLIGVGLAIYAPAGGSGLHELLAGK